jgi:hypothetical protein
VGQVELEERRVDGSGWVRAVGELLEAIAFWGQAKMNTILLTAGAVIVAMVVLRLLIRGGFRRSTRH